MWFDGYHKQFGNRLDDFMSAAIPEALAELTPEEKVQVTEGAKEFPVEVILGILNSKQDYEDKVTRIVAITGTWMNAASGSQWAIGPLSSTNYSERVGIGIRWEEVAFAPLLKTAEDLVDVYPTWPSVLMDFAESQESGRDYFLDRIQKATDASTVEPSPLSDKYESKQ